MKIFQFIWKALFVLFFLTLFSVINDIYAQQCQTDNSSPSNPTPEIDFANAQGPFLVKIYVHILRQSDSTGGLSAADAQASVDFLNGDFNPQNIFFHWEDCAIRYIDNDTLFDLAETAGLQTIFNSNSEFTSEFFDQFHSDGIDLFLLAAYPDGLGDGFAIGVQSEPSTACVVRGTLEDPPFSITALSHVLSHEVGHCLGLVHTHGPIGQVEVENSDGSECLVKGDFLCDTPPDPKLNFNIDENCNWTVTNKPDYDPDTRNIMAYTHDICRNQGFTPDQGRRMRNILSRGDLFPLGQDFLVRDSILTNTNWDLNNTPGGERIIDGNLIIEPDATLTIGAGVTVRFGQLSHLNIKPGGKLVLGGTLTSKNCSSCGVNDNCGPGWKGLVLEGQQARLICASGSVIENAEVGIKFYHSENPGTNPGPSITANFATFRNNRLAFETSDTRYSPFYHTGYAAKKMKASFALCDFEVDDSYALNSPFIGFAKLVNSTGITFKGSKFTNNQISLAPDNIDAYGFGISSVNSEFRVVNELSEKCEFKNLGFGIYAGAGLSANTPFWVEQSLFENCGVGITNRGVDVSTIIFNQFKMGYLPANSDDGKQYGISLANSIFGIQLEGNNFFLETGSPNQTTIGIHCYNLGTFNNTIRINSFTGLTVANQAGGVNGVVGNEIPRGLYYECNTNNSTTAHDFLICDYDQVPDLIKDKQGLSDGSGYNASGNTFAYTGSPADRDFSNAGEEVEYFYSIGGNEIPLNFSNIVPAISNPNTCPESEFNFFPNNPQELIQQKQIFLGNKIEFDIAKAAFETAQSNGNTFLANQNATEGDYYQKNMDESSFKILLGILYDSLSFEQDSFLYWQGQINNFGAQVSLASNTLAEGSVVEALSHLEHIPNQFTLNNEQSMDLVEVTTLFNLLNDQPPLSLAKEEAFTLESISNATGEFAPGLASNILQLDDRLPRPGLCGSSGGIGIWNQESEKISLDSNAKIEVYPVPADGDVFFKWPSELLKNKAGELLISNSNGVVNYSLNLSEGTNSFRWMTRDIPSGIYFFQILSNKILVGHGKIVLQR